MVCTQRVKQMHNNQSIRTMNKETKKNRVIGNVWYWINTELILYKKLPN